MNRFGLPLRRFLWRVRSQLPVSVAVMALLLPLAAAVAAASQASRMDPAQLRNEIAQMDAENEVLMAQVQLANRRREAIRQSGGLRDLAPEQALVLLLEEGCGLPRERYQRTTDSEGAGRIRVDASPLSGLCAINGIRLSGLHGSIKRLEVGRDTLAFVWQGAGES